MARARNIKPGFFKNYLLADLGPCCQILFAGLWCLADREGRLEDKPRLIKAELFPYYDFDVNGGLTELERCNFVKRYTVNGESFIEVQNFKKHQSPHGTEKASVIPDPKDADARNHCSATTPEVHRCLTVDSQNNNGGNRPDSLIHRFSDSLIPDSPIPDSPPQADAPKRSANVKLADLIADGVTQQVAEDFLTQRRAKRAPLTKTALSGIKNEAAKARITLEDALRTCIERGWQGFNADWYANQPATGKRSSHDLSGKDWNEGINPDGSF
jgi:hypothetical protein